MGTSRFGRVLQWEWRVERGDAFRSLVSTTVSDLLPPVLRLLKREKKIAHGKHDFVWVRSFFEAVLLARDAYTVYASLTPILASTLIATYTKSCFPYTQHFPVITLFVCVFHSYKFEKKQLGPINV